MANYITQAGLKKIQEELEELKNVKRQEIRDRIRVAISFGDLSENFEYAAAKEEQEMIERRIIELEDMLNSSTMVSQKKPKGEVNIGSKVLVESGGTQIFFVITGPQEANPIEGKLSAESPLGQALLGKKQGDKVKLDTPGGKAEYSILEIK